MRLKKHDEIVEAMAKEACQRDGFIWEAISSTLQCDYIRNARAALDALLVAVMEKDVGKVYGGVNVSVNPNGPKHGAAIVLKLETGEG